MLTLNGPKLLTDRNHAGNRTTGPNTQIRHCLDKALLTICAYTTLIDSFPISFLEWELGKQFLVVACPGWAPCVINRPVVGSYRCSTVGTVSVCWDLGGIVSFHISCGISHVSVAYRTCLLQLPHRAASAAYIRR